MITPTQDMHLVTEVDTRTFFQEAIQSALSHQHRNAQQETIVYLVNMLSLFLRSEALFEAGSEDRRGHKPLALIYGEALDAPSVHSRDLSLKRLGDIALFISGLFANSLNRSSVDVDYYIQMGGNAYGFLADSRRVSRETEALKIVYVELAGQFAGFVDVLAEVGEETNIHNSSDIMRLYEIWQRTGSQRSLKRLQSAGIYPMKARATHH